MLCISATIAAASLTEFPCRGRAQVGVQITVADAVAAMAVNQNHDLALDGGVLQPGGQGGQAVAADFFEFLGQFTAERGRAVAQDLGHVAQRGGDAFGRFIEDQRAGHGRQLFQPFATRAAGVGQKPRKKERIRWAAPPE